MDVQRFRVGAVIELCGFEAEGARKLNGQLGQLMESNVSQGRVAVKLFANDKIKKMKVERVRLPLWNDCDLHELVQPGTSI